MRNTVPITLPENIGEITLGQFLKYEELLGRKLDATNFNKRKISIFTGVPFNKVQHIKNIDADRILNQIDTALSTDAQFQNRFKMHDMEFGFIPDFDKITLDEYADLTKYGVDKETLHNLMAVLFRPINNKDGDKYDIVGYNGTVEYAEMMKDMPLNCVNGALVFFWNLANELQAATQKYLSEELRREMKPRVTSRISDGIHRLRNWLTMTSLKSMQSVN